MIFTSADSFTSNNALRVTSLVLFAFHNGFFHFCLVLLYGIQIEISIGKQQYWTVIVIFIFTASFLPASNIIETFNIRKRL